MISERNCSSSFCVCVCVCVRERQMNLISVKQDAYPENWHQPLFCFYFALCLNFTTPILWFQKENNWCEYNGFSPGAKFHFMPWALQQASFTDVWLFLPLTTKPKYAKYFNLKCFRFETFCEALLNASHAQDT